MSSEGFLIIEIRYRAPKKGYDVNFSSFGLPRFEDYLSELKKNTETYLNNVYRKNDGIKIDELQRFVKEDIYSICGKKPIIHIVELNKKIS